MNVNTVVKEIDPLIWFGERKLGFTPIHFVKAKTPVTPESEQWILNTLRGRFSFLKEKTDFNDHVFTYLFEFFPAFEDPQEAILYELTWC